MQSTPGHPTRFWRPRSDGRIECTLCPRRCALKNGQRGLCFVRGAEAGAIVLFTYGRSSGFCIDPIEKKPLNHFYPGTPILSFGTAGCNLTCKFCQNWDISKSQAADTLALEASPAAIAATAARQHCSSVAFTYNDPVVFLEYAVDVARSCHAAGIQTVAVTAGYIEAEGRRELFRHIDAANVDLKAFTEDFYRRLSSAHLQPVLDTLRYIRHETGVWLELTTLLIPGRNDSESELSALTDWVVHQLGPDVPLHFTAFHPDWKLRDSPPTPLATLQQARSIARRNGVRHVYTGNIHDWEGQSTYCAGCGELLIERNWYTLGRWNLNENGSCRKCGVRLAGRFSPQPGDWGARRQRVAVHI